MIASVHEYAFLVVSVCIGAFSEILGLPTGGIAPVTSPLHQSQHLECCTYVGYHIIWARAKEELRNKRSNTQSDPSERSKWGCNTAHGVLPSVLVAEEPTHGTLVRQPQ